MGGMLKGHSKLGFEIKFEITISRFEITVFEITVVEVKPSSLNEKTKHLIREHLKSNEKTFPIGGN